MIVIDLVTGTSGMLGGAVYSICSFLAFVPRAERCGLGTSFLSDTVRSFFK